MQTTTIGQELAWLHEPAAADPARTGGKAANLARLAPRHPVPPGFAIAGPAGMRPDLERLRRAYRQLAELSGVEQPAVAVRSSAVDEDGAEASFAGQHETILNVRGLEAVADAIEESLASFGSPRALDYRRELGLTALPERVAVLVQQLVPADASAVVFSANPVSGSRDEAVVTASHGLGESIVGGTVTPDTYVLRRPALTLLSRRIAEKRRMTVRCQQGTREVAVPPPLARRPAIDDGQAREAAALAVAIEEEAGWPVDLEVAWHGSLLQLLQCRPITSLPPA